MVVAMPRGDTLKVLMILLFDLAFRLDMRVKVCQRIFTGSEFYQALISSVRFVFRQCKRMVLNVNQAPSLVTN